MQASPPSADVLASRLAGVVRYLMTTSGGRDFLAAIDEVDLSLSQLKALHLLDEADADVPLKDLGEGLGLSLPAISRAVEGLVRRGLATRAEDAEDRRAKRVAVTAEGRAIVRDLLAIRLASIEAFVADLTDAERRALGRALELLGERDEIAALCPPPKGARA